MSYQPQPQHPPHSNDAIHHHSKKTELCEFAAALRPPENSLFDNAGMNVFLAGGLDTNKLGMMMYHNKVNHQCTVVDQCSQLVQILAASEKNEVKYDKGACLTEVLNVVEKLESVDQALGIRPQQACTHATEYHQLDHVEKNLKAIIYTEREIVLEERKRNYSAN